MPPGQDLHFSPKGKNKSWVFLVAVGIWEGQEQTGVGRVRSDSLAVKTSSCPPSMSCNTYLCCSLLSGWLKFIIYFLKVLFTYF